jgi:hypothetical protein
MAVTTAQTADVAQVLADIIGTVEGLRVTWWISDAARPPVAVIAQPEIDYTDPEAPFCFARWTFPVAIVVERANDRDAQRKLSAFVAAVAVALNDADPPDGVFDITPLTARPSTVAVAGTDLPAYELRVRVRA